MMLPRSFVPVALLSLAVAGAAACKDDPPPPKPEPAPSATGTGRATTRNPSLAPKVDPQAMKEYRADVCYYGTLTLRQARDAYLASLGKDEPSEKKIPSFGAPSTPAAAGTAAAAASAAPKGTGDKAAVKPVPKLAPAAAKPATAGSAAPAAAAAPAAKAPTAAGSAKPAASAAAASDARPEGRRPQFDIAMRAPHERNARACTVALGLKDAPMPDVDAALAAFAPYAVELAKNITAATTYYQREEYKKDSFEKGKELHKKLVADFQKLDELSDKLGTSLTAWHKDHQPDPAKLDAGQKLVLTAYDDAREVLHTVLPKKIDVAAYKERVAKLEKSVEEIKTHAKDNAADPWAKNVAPSMEAFLRSARDAQPKISEKGIEQDVFLSLITGLTAVVEAKYRALSRSLMPRMMEPRPTIASPTPPGAAAPPTPPGAAAPPAQEAPKEAPKE